MAFCSNCGVEVNDGAAVCIKCGHAVNKEVEKKLKKPDASSFGFSALSFFYPIVGLILWLIWKDDFPLKAKSCGKGALIGTIVMVTLYIVLIAVTVILTIVGGQSL